MMNCFHLTEFPIENKTVFLRVDYNVPLDEQKKNEVKDNTKIKSSLQTIKYLLSQNCKIVIATHLGDPKGQIISKLKVDPLARELKKFLPKDKIIKINDCFGKGTKEIINHGQQKEIFFLENLRFYKEEEENDLVFAHSLADLAEVYVNEAFAVCHRKHASVSAITNFLPSIPGFWLEKEISNLNKAFEPEKPSIWIMGGAKLNKIGLIHQALKKADKILIGGALAFSFLKAKGIPVGVSKIDAESISLAKEILDSSKSKKIILPLDFVVTNKLSPDAKTEIVHYNQIQSHQMGLDLGPKTTILFERYLHDAKTIIWNGPLGYFEWAKFAASTKEIGRFLGRIDAIKIAGGGETVEAINKFHLEHNFTHVSTGGGASLEFLSGKRIPGIDALIENYNQFRKKVNKGKWK